MNWRDFLLGVGIVGAFVALGIGMTKALSSHPKQERRLNCKFIPTGEIVADFNHLKSNRRRSC